MSSKYWYDDVTEPRTPVQELVVLGDILESVIAAKYYIDGNDIPIFLYGKCPCSKCC
ncbi:MAG: hypothetical protein ACRC6U_07635 [Fusobacteriaceae bacterium]